MAPHVLRPVPASHLPEEPLPRTTKPRVTTKKPPRTARTDRARPLERPAPAKAEGSPESSIETEGTAPPRRGKHGDGVSSAPPARAPDQDAATEEDIDHDIDPDATLEPSGDEPPPSGAPRGAESAEDDEPRSLAREPGTTSSIERFDALSMYLREVQRHPLLAPEETHALAVRFLETQDSALAARLVTANLRLVVKIAYEYRRAYKNIMDLIQEGNIGLMQAVKRYDPYRGVKLSSYAAWWIRAYILRFILNNWRLVKLGTTQAQRKLFFNLRKKRAELQSLGIDPTNAEIAKQLNVPENEVEEMDVRLQASEKSLDAPVGDAEGRATAKIDMMPSLVEGPESIMADGELQALLKDKLGNFRKTLTGKDKELAIFDERLVADEPLTLQELGDRFGISRERVRQLEQRLTGRLREYLREEMGDAVGVA
jgi:RNA polymerase sigma-32 factor